MPEQKAFRWYPGYTVVGAVTVSMVATAPGQTFVLSQFNAPLREAFGIGELALNTSYALATVAASLPLVWVGAWTDRVGPRKALALVALVFGFACLAMSAAGGFATVVLGFFLLRFLGQGALSMVSQHATAMWFHRRLGEIHGIKQVLVFLVWVPFPQIALALIGTVGWRWSYVVFALFVWLTVIPLALLAVRDRPEDVGLRMDADPPPAPAGSSHEPAAGGRAADGPAAAEPAFTLSDAIRTPAYRVLASVVFVTPLIGTAILFDMQPLLARRGMGPEVAAWAVSAWTAGMALSAIPAGRLTDRIRPARLLPAGMAAQAASTVVLWAAPAPMVAVAGMALLAVGQTTVQTSSTAAIARYFGRAHHGAIRSSLMRIGVVGTGLGPVITGLSANRTDGYAAATLIFVALCLPVAIATLRLSPPEAGPGSG